MLIFRGVSLVYWFSVPGCHDLVVFDWGCRQCWRQRWRHTMYKDTSKIMRAPHRWVSSCFLYLQSGCWTKNTRKTTKIDGENNGKPYEQMEDLGGFTPLFLVLHPSGASWLVEFFQIDPDWCIGTSKRHISAYGYKSIPNRLDQHVQVHL